MIFCSKKLTPFAKHYGIGSDLFRNQIKLFEYDFKSKNVQKML